MADYTVGNLIMDLGADVSSANRRLTATTKRIEALSTAYSHLSKSAKTLNIGSVNAKISGGRNGGSSDIFSTRQGRNVSIFATLGKFNYLLNMARYYGQTMAKIVQYGMDYVETLNLWQVANRDNIDLAEEFLNKMTQAYGISEQALMNYQAIFKNMLSALGDLSSETTSTLSMQLTQMALDFSSLYNVSIESAMQKYQAVLSGQVRPIRSISGYDITENTIFDLYQQAGGEKSMRQLSQLEKRLLRIVAVYDQMSATGAVGDMAKTIESASNQSRIMVEQFKEIMTWSGQVILLWLNGNKVFQYVNAALMTAKEIIKQIAIELGYTDQNFLDGMMFSAESAEEAVDSLQGKLLSFDKFEVLNSDESILGIDPTVESMLSRINLSVESFQMESAKIAQEWLNALGIIDENGNSVANLGKTLEDIRGILTYILSVAVAFGGMSIATKIQSVAIATKSLTKAFLGLGIGTTIFSLIELITKWDELSDAMKIVYISLAVLGTVLTVLSFLNKRNATAALENASANLTNAMSSQTVTTAYMAQSAAMNASAVSSNNLSLSMNSLTKANVANSKSTATLLSRIGTLALGVTLLGGGLYALTTEWDNLSTGMKIVVSLMTALGAALTVITIKGWLAASAGFANATAWTLGIGAVAVITALAAGLATIRSEASKGIDIPMHANGAFGIRKGQLFIANEAGAEMVGSINGRTSVANNQQIVESVSQGVYDAVISAMAQTQTSRNGDVYIDGKKVGKIVAQSVYQEGARIGVFK